MSLNSNFTTIEQSNRLLELGLPKNSADLYYNKFGALEVIPEYRNFNEFCDTTDTPCWSVGRLMEIFVIARGYEDGLMSINGRNSIEYLIRLFAMNRDEKFKFDFSKLEE